MTSRADKQRMACYLPLTKAFTTATRAVAFYAIREVRGRTAATGGAALHWPGVKAAIWSDGQQRGLKA